MIFNALIPELYITDYRKSLLFYTDLLGFRLEYERSGPAFAFLSYGSAQLMLQELAPGEIAAFGLEQPFGRGINFEIATDDLAGLVEALELAGYPLVSGPEEYWRAVGESTLSGSREFMVRDPDGYLLRFAQSLGEKRFVRNNI